MTYGEAKDFVTTFLKGDNSGALVLPIHFRMGIMEIESLCIPSLLKAEYTGTETDVFRMLHSEEIQTADFETKTVQNYLKNPPVPSTIVDDDELPIDQQLGLGVVFFICSYLSNKEKEHYEKKAEKIISIYVSNEIAG